MKTEREANSHLKKQLLEFLRLMGNKIEFMPVDKLCDVYLPDSKLSLIIVQSKNKSVATGELNPTTEFCKQTLINNGLTPVLVDFDSFINSLERSNEEVVSYLSALSNFYLT